MEELLDDLPDWQINPRAGVSRHIAAVAGQFVLDAGGDQPAAVVPHRSGQHDHRPALRQGRDHRLAAKHGLLEVVEGVGIGGEGDWATSFPLASINCSRSLKMLCRGRLARSPGRFMREREDGRRARARYFCRGHMAPATTR